MKTIKQLLQLVVAIPQELTKRNTILSAQKIKFGQGIFFSFIFCLDTKETKNQEITMLSPRKACPRPPFFRACALLVPLTHQEYIS